MLISGAGKSILVNTPGGTTWQIGYAEKSKTVDRTEDKKLVTGGFLR
jgi:hypothetical protein